MTNPFYNHVDGVPANQSRGVSSIMRGEFDLISAGFDLVAPLANPVFTGVPTAPTAANGTATTQIATTAFVISNSLSGSLPGQAGNAGKYITTNGFLASWADLVGITQATSDNSTNVATTAYVVNRVAQDAPSKTGTGASGSWNITAAIATNIAGGTGGRIAYQSGVGATGFVAVGTAGQLLTSGGAGAPAWISTVPVTAGGTGVATLTGYVKGNGASNFSAVSTIPYADLTGVAASGANADITSLTGLTTAVGFVASGTSFRALRIQAIGISNYSVVCTADEAVLRNTAGSFINVTAVNKTINANGTVGAPLSIMSARAASTFYYRWLWYNIAQGLTATLDISSTAPTAPTGYVSGDYKLRLAGACLTDASGSTYLMQTSTKGTWTEYVPLAGSNTAAYPTIVSGASGTISALVAASITPYLPVAIAASAKVILTGGSGSNAAAAPSAAFVGGAFGNNQPPLNLNGSASTSNGLTAEFDIQSNNFYFFGTNANNNLQAMGWRDV